MAAARRGSAETFNFPRTIRISHLGGLEVRYRMNGPYKQYKPSLVLINSFTTSLDLYASQFEKTELTDAMNLIAIEPLGHGGTNIRTASVETFTYWDTAHAVVQVLDAIGVKKAFALGTSQGGWIVVRLALIAPDRVCLLTCSNCLQRLMLMSGARLQESSPLARPWTTKASAPAD
jgi:pimeloyl-ACP methyl ester carboxylesterase